MNTQASPILSRDERRAFEASWRAFAAKGAPDASAFILQAVLRNREPKRGFTAISSAPKLANGHRPWQGYEHALGHLARQLGAYLYAIWRELAGNGIGPTRYESVLRELQPRISQLKKGA